MFNSIQEALMLGKYSKAYGALIGGIVSTLVIFGIVPDGALSPDAQAAIVTLASTLTVIFFPKNSNT